MAGPAELGLHQDGVNAGEVCTGEDLGVGNLFLPLDAENPPEAGGVEVVQLPCMPLVEWPFPVTNVVEQGCVLAPTLFSLMYFAMLSHAFRDSVVGIGIKYRTDGSLFNLRRLKAKTKVKASQPKPRSR